MAPYTVNGHEYIHVSCKPGFFCPFLQVSMPEILHEALPILLYPMNKIQYAEKVS